VERLGGVARDGGMVAWWHVMVKGKGLGLSSSPLCFVQLFCADGRLFLMTYIPFVEPTSAQTPYCSEI
jgi:hypothetical protein